MTKDNCFKIVAVLDKYKLLYHYTAEYFEVDMEMVLFIPLECILELNGLGLIGIGTNAVAYENGEICSEYIRLFFEKAY